jgi:hypothetical protein
MLFTLEQLIRQKAETLTPFQKGSVKLAYLCQEVHNYCRGIYLKYVFYRGCLDQDYARTVTNKNITYSSQADLNKFERKTYSLKEGEKMYRDQISKIIGAAIKHFDRIHVDYSKKLMTQQIDVFNGLIYYSSYVLDLVTTLNQVYQLVLETTVKTRMSLAFPILPYSINEQKRLQTWTPELVFSGFESANNLTENLVSKPIVKLWLLHKELLKFLQDRSQLPLTVNLYAAQTELTKNQQSVDQLATHSNEIQQMLEQTYCLNGLNTLHPEFKKNRKDLEKVVCLIKQNEIGGCNQKKLFEYDRQVLIDNTYPSINGSEKHRQNQSSVELYSQKCSSSGAWMQKVNVIALQVNEDVIKTTPLTIPRWFSFDKVVIVV